MARRAWLLVEWVEEKNMIPSYGIVNVDTSCFKESDLQPGKKIFISLKLNEPRRAQIIRISERKSHVQEHKEFLERQDQQVKNVLQLCMRTIKEMKSEQVKLTDFTILERVTKSNVKRECHPPQHKRVESISYHNRSVHSPVVNQRSRSVISSTPLPGNRAQQTITLCFDQGTQTDNTLLQPPLAKIEEMESVLKQLYGRFQALVIKVNNPNASIDMSEPEQNDISYMEPMPIYNEAWVPNNVAECVEIGNLDDNNVDEGDEDHTQPIIIQNLESKVNVKMEGDRLIKENPMRVRRMSAQTTETEMVNATHSLTGKQSPAHLNKPPKKILDPKLVDDIVKTVSVRCGVPKNLVRNSITVKCTDEAKLYRNRQRHRISQAGLLNEENVPPLTTRSPDESAN
ncbi:Uncharacterized protein OBRU01_10581 [Operophtera brumata]|uniref:BEN domain-containing protein n=1 Tax=Operophtera brumata TaxID=104452 RepID=A0A0L7LDY4_OPEBR|nr:Uncharacterized protein OBRU01_10581 [Operophtera brumata]